MKIKQRTSYQIEDNFIYNLLKDRGIIQNEEDYETFLNPTKQMLLDYNLLDYIQEAAELIESNIKEGKRIYLVVDCD